ncbi:MAG: glycosyltransferase family 2 protein [Clostridia bacterium]|nr:glycosyltransferase family 2 protein [Clostridia bacterium]
MSKKLLTVLIPAYNEESNLLPLHERLCSALAETEKNYDLEFLFINDGSRDNTLKILKEMREKDKRVSYVSFSRNFGKETAMIAGMDYARGDGVVIMDADLQHPPEVIPRMIAEWEKGADDVYGVRTNRNADSALKKIMAKAYYKWLQKRVRYPIYPDVGDFRLLDRRCVEAIKSVRETSRSTKNIYAFIGYNKVPVSYEVADRASGESKFSMKSLINLALDGICSFTVSPLKIALKLGIASVFGGFVYLLVRLLLLWCGDIVLPVFFPVMAALPFFFGALFIIIGIYGEYIGRMFNETKARPLYFVDEYNDKKV